MEARLLAKGPMYCQDGDVKFLDGDVLGGVKFLI